MKKVYLRDKLVFQVGLIEKRMKFNFKAKKATELLYNVYYKMCLEDVIEQLDTVYRSDIYWGDIEDIELELYENYFTRTKHDDIDNYIKLGIDNACGCIEIAYTANDKPASGISDPDAILRRGQI